MAICILPERSFIVVRFVVSVYSSSLCGYRGGATAIEWDNLGKGDRAFLSRVLQILCSFPIGLLAVGGGAAFFEKCNDMSLSQELWLINQDLVQASLNHPFVQGIGDGSLPKTQFSYYVGQDAFFLDAFARAYSIAAAKAPDWQGFKLFHELAKGVLDELGLHESYAQSWNVDLSTMQPGRATRQYTDFLLATAWSQPIGVTAVAMSPCMRLYAYLGQQLAQQVQQNNWGLHAYTDWIKTYGSDDFEPLAQQLEALVEQYADDTALVRSTYRYAMVCERDFFEAAWQHS